MRIIYLLLSLITLPAFAVAPAYGDNNNTGTMMQQNTSQALQIFQNVNYKTLSGNQNQNFFFDDNDDMNMDDIAKQFKLAPENE